MKHSGITITLIAYGQIFYYMNRAQLIRKRLISCMQGIRRWGGDKKIHSLTTSKPKWKRHWMKRCLVDWSSCRTTCVTEISLKLWLCFLATCLSNRHDAKRSQMIAWVKHIMSEQTYLRKTGISDKRLAFGTETITEMTDFVWFILEIATSNRTHTVGMFGRTHASFKRHQALKNETNKRRSMCYKYVNVVLPNYITTNHTNIGFQHSRMFSGRIAYNVLNLRMGI